MGPDGSSSDRVEVGNGRFRMCSGPGTESCWSEHWEEGLPVIYGRKAIGGAGGLLITRTLERLIRHTLDLWRHKSLMTM